MDNSSSALSRAAVTIQAGLDCVMCVCISVDGPKKMLFLSELMKQKQTHSGTMMSASIQQANVINHEIQGQRALHPELLPWQTLQKCHICTFPSFLWPHWLAASQLQPLFLKKRGKHTQILLCTCIFTHIFTLSPCLLISLFFSMLHAHKQSFRQCWERKRFTRARYRRTQAIWDISLGLFPLILFRHLLSSRTRTHAQTQSPVLSVTPLPSMFTDRIVVALSF